MDDNTKKDLEKYQKKQQQLLLPHHVDNKCVSAQPILNGQIPTNGNNTINNMWSRELTSNY